VLKLYWRNRAHPTSLKFAREVPEEHQQLERKYAVLPPEEVGKTYQDLLTETKVSLLKAYPTLIESVFADNELEWPLTTGAVLVVRLPSKIASGRVAFSLISIEGREEAIERYTSAACFVPEQAAAFVSELLEHLNNHLV